MHNGKILHNINIMYKIVLLTHEMTLLLCGSQTQSFLNVLKNELINETKRLAVMSVQSNQYTAISAFCSADGRWPTVILIPVWVLIMYRVPLACVLTLFCV
jgi:hypothetical protein